MRHAAVFLLVSLLTCWGLAQAQTSKGSAWATLSPAQKEVLAPLQQDWPGIDAQRQQKWLAMAARFPAMPADERARIKERMADWARLSTAERGQARLQFLEARQLPADERQAKWQEYQALTGDQRRALSTQAKSTQAKAGSRAAAPKEAPTAASTANTAGATSNTKQNVVPAQALAGRQASKPVTGTAMQAKPGATTTSITARTTPPAHHQPGLPKIAATPSFVDPATLLPQRGPQGAAVQAAGPSEPPRQP
jgi:Protein of unknown function (DUF3106)